MKPYATPEGTRLFQNERQLPQQAYRTLGATDLTVSTLGFGCYRISDKSETHFASLKLSVEKGTNLIDTSTNYADGGSETCVGNVLKSISQADPTIREKVVVVSKVGYVQGQNLKIVRRKELSNQPYPDVVRYMDGCWHCIHPRFIEDQLSLSLERLKLECLDCLLLHNPEYYFADAQKKTPDLSVGTTRKEFYRRIKLAFEHLETEVSKGRIRFYGISSNTFGYSQQRPDATSLLEMWKIAEDISGQHHFRVIQLPANLIEQGAITEKNCDGFTTLEFAEKKQVGVLVNRPLNAIMGNELIRLAHAKLPQAEKPFEEALEDLVQLEEKFQEEIATQLTFADENQSAKDLFQWGREISRGNPEQIPFDHWKEIEKNVIRPQVLFLIQNLDQQLKEPLLSVWQEWRDTYVPVLNNVLDAVHLTAATKANEKISSFEKKLDKQIPEGWRKESLSRKALATLIHTRGVSCVLNGMRENHYVEDSLGAMNLPKGDGNQVIEKIGELVARS